jgi:hypothetical protein
MGSCGYNIIRLKIVIKGNIIEQVRYFGNKISEFKTGVEYKLRKLKRINGII